MDTTNEAERRFVWLQTPSDDSDSDTEPDSPKIAAPPDTSDRATAPDEPYDVEEEWVHENMSRLDITTLHFCIRDDGPDPNAPIRCRSWRKFILLLFNTIEYWPFRIAIEEPVYEILPGEDVCSNNRNLRLSVSARNSLETDAIEFTHWVVYHLRAFIARNHMYMSYVYDPKKPDHIQIFFRNEPGTYPLAHPHGLERPDNAGIESTNIDSYQASGATDQARPRCSHG